MQQFSLEFLSRHAGWILGLAPAFVALAIWVYYRTAAPLDRPSRTVLRILRALAFLIVLFALSEPVLTLVLPEPGKPGLAVLVDGSASMGLSAADTAHDSRAEQAAAIAGRIERALGDRFRLDWFRMTDELRPLPGPPEPAAEGNTAIGGALDRIEARQSGRPVGGVLLLSDGANTFGRDPLLAARPLGVPVFPVPLGGAEAPADARILQVQANPVAFTGEPMPIEVVIADDGAQERTATVEVRDGENLLASETVTLSGGGTERSLRLEVRPRGTGLRRFRVDLAGAEDAVVENDRRSVAVRVLEKKNRVLVLEGRLDWDHAFLRRTLEADSTFAYRFLLADRSGRWLPDRAGAARPSGPGDLQEYAAIVLGDLPGAAFDARLRRDLAAYVERGGGLLVLGGREGVSRLRIGPLAGLLPVEATRSAPADRPFPVELEAEGRRHPITAIGERPAEAERLWSSLPPVWPSPDRMRVKPGSSVLLQIERNRERQPALVAGFAGEGKVAVLAVHGFWRWAFLPRGAGDASARVYPELALRLIRWLAEPTLRDRFVAGPPRGVFANGEPPEIEARVVDERYQPIVSAQVRVEISPADTASGVEPRTFELRPSGAPGEFSGSTPPLPPGP
ncbi:MAG: hypothetical protein GF346_09420, partial [Candidatus Eisenbacteria bacterium]|nr:hypothetical protein [Candidatus Latescibacterota bacterium]MBD3302651.1 hypothetical protein [Candidatus Eisenbacteria bacterium]